MSSPQIVYPLDLTGTASSNLITGEVHDLSGLPATQNRAFVLNYGPFFTDGLVVTNLATGQPLKAASIGSTGGQYVATQLFVDATLRTGKDICAVIVITDLTLPAGLQVSVTAQMLGGDYSASVDAIQQLINGLSLGSQPVAWAGILGKPVLFPPAPHLHDLGDVYGFEYMVAALERIVQAIYIGDTAQLNAIYQYIDHEVAGLQTNISTVAQNLTIHESNYSNPHQVTATQVGLGNVQNYPLATTAQAQAGAVTTAYMTPALTAAAIAAQVGNAFQAHISNYSNPHQVTAAQVGLGSVPNYPLATVPQAQAGTNNTALMTPYLTAAAISTQALTPLNAHINNTSNPHLTTAAQVGLGNVQNFGLAATADAQTGTSNALYMTPLLTAQAIQYQVGNTLNAHINNLSNPHQTTAAQVGLGNVQNYGIATTAQAQAGTATNAYMTPALTASAVTTQALGPLNAHIANLSNPHQVTKAQVGLGSVTNNPQVIAGGGTNMLGNVVRLGWSGSAILAQVDATPMGTVFTASQPDPNLTSHLGNYSNPHQVTAAQVGLGNVNNTSDLNKPISNATQAALNTKPTTNTQAQFSGIFLSTAQDVYLYESSTGNFTVRTGTSAGYNYSTIDGAGNMSIAGQMTASTFRPSDIALKDNPEVATARPLWRELNFWKWDWNAKSGHGGHSTGTMADDVKRAGLTEYLSKFRLMRSPGDPEKGLAAEWSPDYDCVDYQSLAFEMALAAGKEIDRLGAQVKQLMAKLAVKE